MTEPKAYEAQPAPAEPRPASFFCNLPSIWKLNAEIRWLVADMIPLKGITLLSAASGTGKTWLAYAIAGAVAHGSRFLDREVIQRPVLYLDGENPAAIVQRDLNELGIRETGHLQAWGGWHSRPPSPDNPEILKFAKQHEPLLIWDSLVEFHDGDEQSASGTRKFMKYFRELANAGATIIILHHTGKTAVSQEYRGSSDIKAAVDMAYVIEGEPRAGALHRLTMRSFKSRFAAGQDFGMEFLSGTGFGAIETLQPCQASSPETVISEIMEAHPDGLNGKQIKELAKAQRIGKHQVDECLRGLPSTPGKGREKIYRPAETAPAVLVPEIRVP